MAYKVYKKNVKWAQAQKYCVGEGADLAVVDSFKKVEYIMDLKGPDRINVHIGIHRFFDNVEWIQVKDGDNLKLLRNLVIPLYRLITFLILNFCYLDD